MPNRYTLHATKPPPPSLSFYAQGNFISITPPPPPPPPPSCRQLETVAVCSSYTRHVSQVRRKVRQNEAIVHIHVIAKEFDIDQKTDSRNEMWREREVRRTEKAQCQSTRKAKQASIDSPCSCTLYTRGLIFIHLIVYQMASTHACCSGRGRGLNYEVEAHCLAVIYPPPPPPPLWSTDVGRKRVSITERQYFL